MQRHRLSGDALEGEVSNGANLYHWIFSRNRQLRDKIESRSFYLKRGEMYPDHLEFTSADYRLIRIMNSLVRLWKKETHVTVQPKRSRR